MYLPINSTETSKKLTCVKNLNFYFISYVSFGFTKEKQLKYAICKSFVSLPSKKAKKLSLCLQYCE